MIESLEGKPKVEAKVYIRKWRDARYVVRKDLSYYQLASKCPLVP